MDQEKVAQSEQAAPAVQEKEGTNKSSDVGELVYEAKKQRKRAQEAKSEVDELKAKIKAMDDDKLKQDNKWRELAERYESENKELQAAADQGRKVVDKLRQATLDTLPEEGRKFAEDMPVDKMVDFAKYFGEQTKPVTTNESSSSPSPVRGKNPFTEMNAEERQRSWQEIVGSYLGK